MDWLQLLAATPEPTDQRKTCRVACSLPVAVVHETQETVGGRLTNLSTAGLKLRLPRTLKPGFDYLLRLKGQPGRAQDAAPELTLPSHCVWCRPAQQGQGYDVGCLFSGFVGVHMDQVLDFFRQQLHLQGPLQNHALLVSRLCGVTVCSPNGHQAEGFIRSLRHPDVGFDSRTPLPLDAPVALVVDFGEGGSAVGHVRVRSCARAQSGWFEIQGTLEGFTAAACERLESLLRMPPAP